MQHASSEYWTAAFSPGSDLPVLFFKEVRKVLDQLKPGEAVSTPTLVSLTLRASRDREDHIKLAYKIVQKYKRLLASDCFRDGTPVVRYGKTMVPSVWSKPVASPLDMLLAEIRHHVSKGSGFGCLSDIDMERLSAALKAYEASL